MLNYTYDAENTRIATTEDGLTTEYVTDTGVVEQLTNKVYFGQKAVSPNFSPQGTFKGASIQSVSDKLLKAELFAN